MASEMIVDHRQKAFELLKVDAEKILKLIRVQMDNLTMPQCPLYEEVLDTQMFGLSRKSILLSAWDWLMKKTVKTFYTHWSANCLLCMTRLQVNK